MKSQPLVAHDAQTVERWEPIASDDFDGSDMVRYVNGAWVKYTDFQAKLAEADARLATLRDEHEGLKAAVSASGIGPHAAVVALAKAHRQDSQDVDTYEARAESAESSLSALRAAVREWVEATDNSTPWSPEKPSRRRAAEDALRAAVDQRGASPR